MLTFLLAYALSPSSRASTPLTVDCQGRGQYRSLVDALAAASTGDRIWVAPCTYYGSLDFEGKTVEIRSIGGPSVTTVLANPGEPVVTVKHGEAPGTLIQGFTLSGGGGFDTPAIENVFSSLTLREVVITGNVGRVTVFNRSGRLLLDRAVIEDNTTDEGYLVHGKRGGTVLLDSTVRCGANPYGFYAEHAGVLTDGTTFECEGATAAVAYYHSIGRVQRSTVEGLVYVENEWVGSEPTTVEDSVLLDGVTVDTADLRVRNVVSLGPVTATSAVLTVEASVLGGEGCGVSADAGTTLTTRYNLLWGDGCAELRDGTSFTDDPLFVDADAGDYSLSGGSPCFDAGPDEAGYADPDGTRNDIGAFGGPLATWRAE